jgi:hypothetical protein
MPIKQREIVNKETLDRLTTLTNTDGSIKVLGQTLAAGQTYTSPSELRMQSDVGVFFRSDQAGTLKFQFSPNNSDWSTFPVNGFTIVANIWEFHTAVKLPRYFRYTYENSSGSTATFDAYVYYGTFRQGNAPLNQSIGDDSDALIVRSVGVGSDPLSNYVNQRSDGYAIYETTPLGISTAYDSGILNLQGYTQIENHIYADQAGTLVGTWYADAAGTIVIRTFTRPYSSLTLDYFSAPVFGRYLRYTYTNGAVAQTEFLLGLRFLTKSISGQLLGLEDFVATNMSVNLGRNIIAGKTEAGQYINAGITEAGELLTNTLASTRQKQANYASGTVSSDLYAVLVDLSSEDYTNFVNIDNVAIKCNFTTNNSDANIKIGVVTRIDGTDGDISFLESVPFSAANANTFVSFTNNYQPSSKRFEVDASGKLVNAATNDFLVNVAAVNTGATLTSPKGNVTPAVGDVIAFFDHTGNNFSSNMSCIYHTD